MSLDILWEEMLGSRFALLYPELARHLILVNPIGLENYLLYSAYKDVDFFYQKELKLTSEDIISYQKNTIMMESGTKNTLSSQIL